MKQSTKTFLVTLAVVAAFLLFTQLRGDTITNISFDDVSLTMTAPQQYTYTVNYDNIQTLELVELPETGSILSGGENRRYSWGERENEVWGKYTICISKKIGNAILVTTADSNLFVFNYENSETTAAILPMFRDLLADYSNENVDA